MTGYLLDTNIALISLAQPERISLRIRKAVEKGPVHLSVLSFWEVVLKCRKGKLEVGDPRSWWTDALEDLAAQPLALRQEHIAVLGELKPIHQDPFERALISQAIVEELVLLTSDAEIVKYSSERLRVIV